jgi:uncharacterized protein (DUF4415 family)
MLFHENTLGVLKEREKLMKKEYDFSKGKRGAVIPQKGKTRITIYIDNDVLEEFRAIAEDAGFGYQTMINNVLRQHLRKAQKPIDEKVLRKVIREELKRVANE